MPQEMSLELQKKLILYNNLDYKKYFSDQKIYITTLKFKTIYNNYI